ncbi:MAG TPA: putative collagen-binding domain-containing protein [Terriglobia bacterium]|nr:putative collagen-binding domain-containing protein [Terriglobia bacterium]
MKRIIRLVLIAAAVASFSVADLAAAPVGANPPGSRALSIYSDNPAYFESPDGQPVVMIGDYEASPTAPTGIPIDPNSDFVVFFDTLKASHLNFAKLWINYGVEAEYDSETPFDEYHRFNLLPYLRVGAGLANDGRPKYDLTQFNPYYFERVAAACAAARARGIYLHLVLIDGWIFRIPALWKYHAYNRANNVSSVDGDPKGTGESTDPEAGSCSLGNTRVLEVEKAYLRRIVDAVNGFDNILFEVSNENYYNLRWEMTLAAYVHEFEKSKPRQHLVMPLDLPDHDYGGVSYGANPQNDHTKSWKTWDLAQLHDRLLAARDLKQPLIYDTDGIESNDNPVQRKGFWTAFVSGGHVNYTDYSFQPEIGGDERGLRRAELRRQLGHLADFTRQVRFWEMHPADLIRSGDAYALASRREAVLYLPQGGNADVDLEGVPGSLRAKWFNPRNGLFGESSAVTGGKTQHFTAPDLHDWVLYLQTEPGGQ